MFIIPNILSRIPNPPPDVTMEIDFKCEHTGKTREKEEWNCLKSLAQVAKTVAHQIAF